MRLWGFRRRAEGTRVPDGHMPLPAGHGRRARGGAPVRGGGVPRPAGPVCVRRRRVSSAVLELNVPLFTAPTDGLQRARERIRSLDEKEIAWQVLVIRQTSPDLSGLRPTDTASAAPTSADEVAALPDSVVIREADAIAQQIADHAIRAGSGAAWI